MKWKIGDFCNYNGKRWLVYKVNDKAPFTLCLVDENGDTDQPHRSQCDYLPECTSWEWQPIVPAKPPVGYKRAKPGEVAVLQFDGSWRLLREGDFPVAIKE